MPIRVVVAKGRGRGPTVIPGPFIGHLETIRTGVEQKDVSPESGAKEVQISIPVGVSGRDPHAVSAGGRNSRGVAKPDSRTAVLEKPVLALTLDEIEVQIAVTVLVEERDSRTHDFGHEITRTAVTGSTGVVDEFGARIGGYVGEARLPRARRAGREGDREAPRGDHPQDQRRSTDRGPMSPRLGVPANCMASLNSARRIRSTASTPSSPKAASPQR